MEFIRGENEHVRSGASRFEFLLDTMKAFFHVYLYLYVPSLRSTANKTIVSGRGHILRCSGAGSVSTVNRTVYCTILVFISGAD